MENLIPKMVDVLHDILKMADHLSILSLRFQQEKTDVIRQFRLTFPGKPLLEWMARPSQEVQVLNDASKVLQQTGETIRTHIEKVTNEIRRLEANNE